MPLDPSIILGVKPMQLDTPMDSATKAMSLSSMMQENQLRGMQLQQNQMNMQNQQALRQAYANNTSLGPNGQPQTNTAGILSDLARVNPMLAAQKKAEFDQQNLEQQTRENNISLNLLSGVTKDNWADTVAQAQKMGISGAENLPQQYPGDQFVHQLMKSKMAFKDQLEQQNKDRGFDIQEREAGIKEKELGNQTRKDFGSPMAPIDSSKGLSQQDPADLVKNLPQHLQAKAAEEIKDRQNIANIYDKSLAAFDQAAKDARPVSAAVNMYKSGNIKDNLPSLAAVIPSHIPLVGDTESFTAGQKAFRGLANTTIKEVEGTSKQAAMESLEKNYMPQTGDSDATIASKRAGWLNYLKSHAAAPVAKGNGIDLDKFASTSFGGKSSSSGKAPAMSFDEWRQSKDSVAGNN